MKTELRNGQILNGRYRITDLLAAGGMSCVYLAEDLYTGMLAAVKKDGGREGRFLSELSHPGIVKLLNTAVYQGQAYLIEEYVDGVDLYTCIRERGPLQIRTAMDIGLQLCSVLGYLHSLNPPMVYRDMKPANIILQSSLRVKLVDFGIARTYVTYEDADTSRFGTPGYAAPEQFSGSRSQSDGRADLYGLGKTLYYLITGEDPARIECTNQESFAERIRAFVYDEGAAEILEKCTEPSADRRYQSAESLAYAIRSWQESNKEGRKRFGKKIARLQERKRLVSQSEIEGDIRSKEQTFQEEEKRFSKRKKRDAAGIHPGAVVLTVFAFLIYASGFLLGLGSGSIGAEGGEGFRLSMALGFWAGALILGTLMLGLGQALRLLHDIKNALQKR